jgi:hypothetical protein
MEEPRLSGANARACYWFSNGCRPAPGRATVSKMRVGRYVWYNNIVYMSTIHVIQHRQKPGALRATLQSL